MTTAVHAIEGSGIGRLLRLAESYGVGRSVVREANKLLEVHRLVRPTRRLGTVVLDPLLTAAPDTSTTTPPPSTGMTAAVMKLASSLARKLHSPATSAGSATRCNGMSREPDAGGSTRDDCHLAFQVHESSDPAFFMPSRS